MAQKIELPVVREQFGFNRTTCDCKACQTWCRHQPGFLVPSDLDRLVPPGADPFAWAEGHLRASPGYMAFVDGTLVVAPSLVPAKKEGGECHWLKDGMCQVHAAAPYGCAYLDQHLVDADAERRGNAARVVRAEAFREDSLYARLWNHLRDRGLEYRTGPTDRARAGRAIRRLAERAARKKVRRAKQRRRTLSRRRR